MKATRFGDEGGAAAVVVWPICDSRMEELVRLRSIAEDFNLSAEERDDAYGRAGRLRPTQDEWDRAREIADSRWKIRRQRALQEGRRPPQPRWLPSRPKAPEPDPDLAPVNPQRAAHLMAAIFNTLKTGATTPVTSPPPPSARVRTDPQQRERYWALVALERRRRSWMRARGREYRPRHSIFVEDLDRDPKP